MTTSVNGEPQGDHDALAGSGLALRLARRLCQITVVRELLILLAFCGFTSLLTWPYVGQLRNSIADKGDPYLIAWIMWWDYHATFTDPLHLFHANTFYPLKYTLAFSEHSYGIALLFFPLYAIGLTPLTVYSVSLFLGFAVSGYGAFRLTRTLTGSTAMAWVSGIVFAFVPYRFNMMSQVAYLFSPWMPLLFEALVLFVRERSKKRAAWLGIAFFMSGISTISWWTFSLIPFVLYAGILLTRYDLWRERSFWQRGTIALSVASLALLPFMLPYYLVSRLYGFKRSIEEIKINSAWPRHWLSVENRNRLWNRMGEGVDEGWRHKLFPGLLPILFSLAELIRTNKKQSQESSNAHTDEQSRLQKWLPVVDALVITLFALSLLSIGFDRTNAFLGFFDNLTSERALGLLTVAIMVRISIAYPDFLTTTHRNLIETLRSKNRSDAFWLGSLLAVLGFFLSLGWNFFLYRLCYYLIPLFKSMRVVTRAALLTYLGLAILSGLGVGSLATRIRRRFPRVQTNVVYVVACLLLLFELNAAPLKMERGETYPDAVTLRLKQTNMRGGIVQLPAGGPHNYRYMLRAADHMKPLIVGTSGFNSAIENKIEDLTIHGTISDEFMNLMESIPTSYLVIANGELEPERTTDYESFLARQLKAGRLRFVNRFDARDDLYAVVKNEPEAKTEGEIPISLSVRDWANEIKNDPVSIVGSPLNTSQRLYRFYVTTTGAMPRYREFKTDLEKISRGVIVGAGGTEDQLQASFREFVNEWSRSGSAHSLTQLDSAQYVDKLVSNAGINLSTDIVQQLKSSLAGGQETQATVLLKIIDDPGFVEKEKYRSILILHYFGYLRRNPDDPPDGNLNGFNFWLDDLERNHQPEKLATAFKLTGEYHQFEKKP